MFRKMKQVSCFAINGVAFDLEGTIINLEPQHHKGHLKAAAEIGVNLSLEEALEKLPHFIGGPDEAVALDIWNISDKKHSPEYILKLSLKHFQEALQSTKIKPRLGFLKFYEQLQKLGFETTIGSATTRSQTSVYLAKSGLARLFPPERIVLGEDVPRTKPAPDVYLETAKRMGIDPRKQLVFEDSPRGVKAARSAGSLVIGMPVYDMAAVKNLLINAGAIAVYSGWGEVNFRSLGQSGLKLSD